MIVCKICQTEIDQLVDIPHMFFEERCMTHYQRRWLKTKIIRSEEEE